MPIPTTDKSGIATLRLQLLGDAQDIQKQEIIYGQDGVFRAINRPPDRAKTDSAGCLTVSFHVPGLVPASLRIVSKGFFRVKCFAAPGDTTVVRLDMRELSRRKADGGRRSDSIVAHISEPLAEVAEELTDWREQVEDAVPKASYDSIAKMNVADYVAYARVQAEHCIAAWNALPLSSATRELAAIDAKLQMLCNIRYARMELEQARMKKKVPMTDDYRQLVTDSIRVCAAQMDELRLLNDRRAWLSEYYANTLNICNDSDMVRIFGTDSGPYFDYIKTDELHVQFSQMKPLDDEGRALAASLPDSYREMVEHENTVLLRKIEAERQNSDYHVNETDSTAAEISLESITARHCGKVLLIDFWGTWCGACLLANNQMKPIKEELKDKDIVYIYIAEDKSPLVAWQNMIPSMGSEHYRLTREQWSGLQKQVGLPGNSAPCYIIADRKGTVRKAFQGFNSADMMKRELLKALGE